MVVYEVIFYSSAAMQRNLLAHTSSTIEILLYTHCVRVVSLILKNFK